MAEQDTTSILIVDDLPEKLLAYRSILEEFGPNAITVPSGEEALKQVLKKDFAVILLDVNMPGMNGFETAHLIRGRKRSAHTPIIFLTAFTDEVQTSRGYATGAVDYMSTPVMPEVLLAKVRVFVELFRMRQQVARQVEEQAKRAAAEESARRSSFLAEASRALTNSLDFEATLRALVRLAVPDLADLSLVALACDEGIGRVEAGWAGPKGATVSSHGKESIRLRPWLADLITHALASPGREHVCRLTEPERAIEPGAAPQSTPDADSVVPPDFPVVSVLILPLAARGKTLGALVLASRVSRRPLSSEEISLAVEVSGRAGVALDNALLVRDIQENDQRKNEFLAMLSHELRNPLAPVRNAVLVLQSCGIEHPKVDWALGVINRQVAQMVRLVDDLLDMSRISGGKIRLQCEAVDAADVVASAVETSRPLIEAHRHRLSVSLPDERISLHADRTRLSQILSNLLNNAAKYTPDGGSISLEMGRNGGDVVFQVRDTGTGISRDMLSKVFDLFTQADCAIDRAQGGLGIGLTLVRRLVEMHHGSVQAYSEGFGRGSEFTVRLPALEDEPPAHAVASHESVAETPAYRVLVVDDNTDSADSLSMLLQMLGHQTLIAYDGLNALEVAISFQPEVVLLDIGLPRLDGYQVARRLREQPGTASCLLIAVSGYGQDEDRVKAQEAGFDHHLTKPLNYEALQALLSGYRKMLPVR
jgi:signal transduction histidine kinase/DNA-binding response OmpR family regulator